VDGYYWWDGTAWQQIPEDERAASTPGSEGATGATGSNGATGSADAAGSNGMSHDELARITSVDQLDERSKPYFEPDADMYPDDASLAEGGDVLSDEPAPGAAGESYG
jgi:hypothetical protein